MEDSAEKNATTQESYFRYWGKARSEGEEGATYHLLTYHRL